MFLQLETGVTKGKALNYINKGKQDLESISCDTVARVCSDIWPVRVNSFHFFLRLTYISKVLVSELEDQKRSGNK